MSSFVTICKFEPNSSKRFKRIAVNNDMKTKVKNLSEMVSKEFEITEDNFDLMCFGRILNGDKTLDSYEITNGTTVWVIKKCDLKNQNETNTTSEDDPNATKPKINQSDIQHMVIALKTALMDSSFRQMLDKLSEPEFRDNLMAVTPGLRDDPTTLAILQDPDLLSTLTEPTNIHKVLEKHPCLLEAATFLSATFHEETIAKENTNGGPSSSGISSRSSSNFNYSLDAMSDDEDMDDGEGSAEPNSSTNSTAQRIAELMVRAYQSNQSSGSSSSQSISRSNSSSFITQDMLREALQSSSQPSTSASTVPNNSQTTSVPITSTTPNVSSSGPPSGPSVSARMRSWATQMQQLRDLGINDEIIALQALEATDGDVQAAINIIFSDNN